MENIQQKLSTISVFQTLSESQIKAIAQLFGSHRFDKGETLISQQDKTSSVYFLCRGKVRAAMFSPSGKEISYQELCPGQMFGEMAALDSLPRSTHVIALEAGDVITLSQENFNLILEQYPAVAKATLMKLVGLVRFLCERLFEVSTLSVAGRVRAELLRLAKQEKPIAAGTIVLENMPTHEELAGRLSTHREAVSRELGQLQRKGLIKKQRSRITILDIEQLASIQD